MLSSCLVHIKTFPFTCSLVGLAVSSVQSKGSLRQLCTITALQHISTCAGTSNCCPVHEQFATGCRLLTVNLATWNSLSKTSIATKTGGVDAWSYKVCALQIDEMEIKKHLEYDRRSGQVYGFTDIGAGMPFSLMHVIICFIVSFTVYSLLNIGWHSD